MKWIAILVLLTALLVMANEEEKEKPKCIRWKAVDGDIWNRKAVCLEWTKPKKEKDK